MIIATLFASYAILFTNDSKNGGITLTPYYYTAEGCEAIGQRMVKRYANSSYEENIANIRYQCVPSQTDIDNELEKEKAQTK